MAILLHVCKNFIDVGVGVVQRTVLQDHQKVTSSLDPENMSSLLWICTTKHNSSQITVIDANNPGQIIEAFHVSSSHILCIASVPGTRSD